VLRELEDRAWLLRAHDAREVRERLAGAVRDAGGARARAAALRRRQQAEMALLAIRDINRQASLRETLKALSGLADATVQEACVLAADELAEEGAPPPPPLLVLGLGRLGYRELDFGSDLDLVFVAGGDGTPETLRSARPFCERVVRLLSTLSRDGQLYRVDLRLRPSGGAGDLVAGRDALLAYLAGSAEVWELQSFLKARVIAGEEGAARSLMESIDALLLARGAGLGRAALLPAVRGMRERLAAENPPGGDRGLKLGPGGIIEIHFIVEFLQLAHGVANPADKDTLLLLTCHQKAGLLDERTFGDLYAAYLFLRAVEHQKRLLYGRPEAGLPADPARLTEIAAALDRTGAGGGERLRAEIEAHRAAVRAAYEAIVRE
jgi:glutamate-ammonia-ligase adenylyltransferase